MITDAGKPQCTNPAAANYLSATTTGAGRIALRIGAEGQRPWSGTVTAQLLGGYLKEGEQITLTFGDTAHGSPGMAGVGRQERRARADEQLALVGLADAAGKRPHEQFLLVCPGNPGCCRSLSPRLQPFRQTVSRRVPACSKSFDSGQYLATSAPRR